MKVIDWTYRDLPSLTDEERAVYDWQLPVDGFGDEGQRRLKAASVLISRCGGVGGVVALELAAAGIGRLILAHGGQIKPSDLNRQLLMTHEGIGKSRLDSAVGQLRDRNPRLDIVAWPENVSSANAAALVAQADVIVDCAPLFEERYALNREAVRQGKPMVECAVYELEGYLTSLIPGQTPCLRCLYPELSTTWKRRFPVFGAVSGVAGCMAAMEVIKLASGLGEPLLGKLVVFDLRHFTFRTYRVRRRPDCPECVAAGQGK